MQIFQMDAFISSLNLRSDINKRLCILCYPLDLDSRRRRSKEYSEIERREN